MLFHTLNLCRLKIADINDITVLNNIRVLIIFESKPLENVLTISDACGAKFLVKLEKKIRSITDYVEQIAQKQYFSLY